MRTLLLLFLLLATLYASPVYKACELTKKEAKAALVNEIVTTIESGFSIKEEVNNGALSKEAKRTIKSSSTLTLSNLSYSEEEGKVCAQITQAELIGIAKGKIDALSHFTLDALPKDELAIVNFLEERLSDIRQAKAITTLISSAFTQEERALIENKQTLFENERSNHFAQKVSFALIPDEAVLSIDGVEQKRHFDLYLNVGKHAYTIKHPEYALVKGDFELKRLEQKTLNLNIAGSRLPRVTFAITQENAKVTVDDKPYASNTPISVSEGDHTYVITAQGFCPVKGSFTGTLGSSQTLTINIEGSTFPQLTVNSNQEKATLQIDGQAWQLGATKQFSVCENKELSYQVTFGTKSQSNTIMLEPGMIKTVSMDFLTDDMIKNLKRNAQSYEQGGRWVARAEYEVSNPLMFGYQLDLLNHNKWLRYGWGGLYANGENQWAANVHYSFALQLTSFGTEDIPLHLGSVAVVIPYIGAQAGIAVQSIPDQGFGLISKFLLGADFVFTKFIALELYYQQEFLLRKEISLGLALSLTSPFAK